MTTLPGFGEALPIRPQPEALAFLARRRSASAQVLASPGPSPQQIDELLAVATRVPDHGKLAPWRFVVLEGEAKAAFVARVEQIAAVRPDADKAQGALVKLRNPPVSIAVISSVVVGHKIPEWEQLLSAGAVSYNLCLAAQAAGWGANWITDWYSEDERVTALLPLRPNERMAGYIHLGTAAEPPLERVRPDLSQIVTRWQQ